jgi:hypothetical protein
MFHAVTKPNIRACFKISSFIVLVDGDVCIVLATKWADVNAIVAIGPGAALLEFPLTPSPLSDVDRAIVPNIKTV